MPEAPARDTIDLLNPSTLFVNRLPDMSGIVERWVRSFRTQLFQDFRLNVQDVDGAFAIVSHDEYLAAREGYRLYGILNIPPIRGLSLITIDGSLLAALVDDLFGADGPTPAALQGSQISIMETRIGRRLMDMLTSSLTTAFQQYFTLQPEMLRTEGFAALASVGDAAEPFCTLTATMGLPTGSGAISIALPYRGLEPMREILGSPAGGLAEKEARSRWAERVAEALDTVPVEIGFEIGRVSLSARALSDLAVGDVLPLTFHRNARAVIGGTPIADIRYGAVGSTYGVSFGHDDDE